MEQTVDHGLMVGLENSREFPGGILENSRESADEEPIITFSPGRLFPIGKKIWPGKVLPVGEKDRFSVLVSWELGGRDNVLPVFLFYFSPFL